MSHDHEQREDCGPSCSDYRDRGGNDTVVQNRELKLPAPIVFAIQTNRPELLKLYDTDQLNDLQVREHLKLLIPLIAQMMEDKYTLKNKAAKLLDLLRQVNAHTQSAFGFTRRGADTLRAFFEGPTFEEDWEDIDDG